MSDTPENQAAYPQHSNQTPGCGFALAKIVVMFSLVTGAGMEVLIAAFKTSEVVLARLVVSYFNWMWEHSRLGNTAARAGLASNSWSWHALATFPTLRGFTTIRLAV